MPETEPLGEIAFSPDGERWIEFGPPDERRRVGFHDYDAIYSTPGLYERVFGRELGMRSTAEVVRLYGERLNSAGIDPAGERVVDFGAGNGIGGEALRALGVGAIVGIDIEPAARTAAERDRPGVYDEYVVADLGDWSDSDFADLTAHVRPTALLALSAVGIGHVPAPVMRRAIGVLGAGGHYGFALAPRLLPGSDDPVGAESGYPELVEELERSTDLLARSEYVHRRRADGSPDRAVAFLGRVRADG
ncbi:class I SAM-dependent methyltransferase [Thermoleophilia bacterium SCSIO 60948]|nr:class I SAM-dependent methyltransferase [Thermoleophilia bacterium SCSIO 60948]